jgi:hypothetical protein
MTIASADRLIVQQGRDAFEERPARIRVEWLRESVDRVDLRIGK